MKTARIVYRYLTVLFLLDVLLQFFLAGAGVFSAGPGTAARDSSTLDPHRDNGLLVMLLALLLLAAAVAARNGRWKQAVPLFVLTLLQPVLAIAGAAGGLHVLNAAAILVIASVLAYQAWRRDRRQPPGPAPEVGDGQPEVGQKAAQQRQGQPDDIARVTVDAGAERHAETIDAERVAAQQTPWPGRAQEPQGASPGEPSNA